MKKLTKIIFVVLAAVVLVSTVAVLAPRAVHALAAQLVQNVDSPPRNPWSASCTTPKNGTGYIADCVIPAVPGYEIAIQSVTIKGYANHSHEQLIIELDTVGGGNPEVWVNQLVSVVPFVHEFGEVVSFNPDLYRIFAASMPMAMYVDPTVLGGGANEIHVTAMTDSTSGGNPNGLGAYVSLVGYSVNIVAPAN